MAEYVTRAGTKLEGAIKHFGVAVAGRDALDLGSHKGGFADCLLRFGARTVTVVDTAYGVLDYKLREDERVIVHERTNALTARFDRTWDIITIDLGWTPQRLILPRAMLWAAPGAHVLSLVKPQYEAEKKQLRRGVVPEEQLEPILRQTLEDLARCGIEPAGFMRSPVPGRGGNVEFFLHIVNG